MSTRPDVIRVAGFEWEVQVADLSAHNAHGLCNPSDHTITLDPGQTLQTEQDTLLHETMHAILRQQGRPYTRAEETFVTALATGLLGVLHDNPALVKYLTSKKVRR